MLHSIKLTFMTSESMVTFSAHNYTSVNEYGHRKRQSPYIIDLVIHLDLRGKSCQDQYSDHKEFDKYCIERRGRWSCC